MSTARRSASSREQEAEPACAPSEIEVLNRQRLYPIRCAAVARLARTVLDRINRKEAAATIIFVDDRRMQQLNRNYRGIDAPTDVLSFAYHEGDAGFQSADQSLHLGDVFISVQTARSYADQLDLSFDREIEFLVIHGLLHLAGYDHETDNGEMNRLERRLRKELIVSRQ